MSLYKRGAIWWTEFERHGQRHRFSTGTGHRRKAEVEEARLKVQVARDPDPRARRGAVPTLIFAGARDVREAEDRGLSPGYTGALETLWLNLRDFFGDDAPLDEIDHRRLAAYEGARRKDGIRGQTIRKELGCLKRAFARAKLDGLHLEEPRAWPRVKSDPPHPSRTGRLVRPEILRDYLAALPEDLRDELTVAALTGLRQAELHRLEASWVKRAGKGWTILVPAGASKTRRERSVDLPGEAKRIIDERKKRIVGPLFPRDRWHGRDALDEAARIAKIPGRLTLRDLRTTYITLGTKQSGDVQAVQDAVGHNDLRTTQRYQRSTIERVHAVGASVARALGLGGVRRRKAS